MRSSCGHSTYPSGAAHAIASSLSSSEVPVPLPLILLVAAESSLVLWHAVLLHALLHGRRPPSNL